MKYEVAVIYKGQSNYIIYADNEEQAKEAAESMFVEGVDGFGEYGGPVKLGNEWEMAIDTVAVMELPEEISAYQRSIAQMGDLYGEG
jgi:hypothetical protein